MTDLSVTIAPVNAFPDYHTLPINDVYGAIQGEGCNTGVPMVIVRVQGCGVGCPFCDTKETWDVLPENEVDSLDELIRSKGKGKNGKYVMATAPDLVVLLREWFPSFKWVMLTGGEPAQYILDPLIKTLRVEGYKVAIETSGTELRGLMGTVRHDWVCVSPKINMPGGKEFKLQSLQYADEIKFVIGKPGDLVKLEAILDNPETRLKPGCTILLQPMSQSKRATEFCIKTVQERGWRLSVQVHQYLQLK